MCGILRAWQYRPEILATKRVKQEHLTFRVARVASLIQGQSEKLSRTLSQCFVCLVCFKMNSQLKGLEVAAVWRRYDHVLAR